MPDTLQLAIAKIKAGDKVKGEQLLKQTLRSDPRNEQAWLWLSSVTDSEQERSRYLRQVLKFNPDNKAAKLGLKALRLRQKKQPKSSAGSDAPSKAEAETNRPEPPPNGTPPNNGQAMAPANVVENTVVLQSVGDSSNPIDTLADSHPSGTYDLFISYSRRDKPFVQKLYESLKNAGREIWIDWGNIPLTADWRKEIREGIERANAVVFVMSPDFLASKECRAELDQAEEFHKRLIPLVYRDIDTSQVPHSLASLNWIFCQKEEDFAAAFEAVQQMLDTDLDWVKAHTRLLVRAAEWDQHNRNYSFLLRGDDLQEAELQVAQADTKPDPTPLQKQYILASRANATKRQRRRMLFVTTGLIVSILLAIFAGIQFFRANAAQKTAERERDMALARQLGAEAIITTNAQPDLAALLSLVAAKVGGEDLVAEEFLASLRHSPYLVTTLHGHTANVRTVDISPDGAILASGGKDQSIILWDMSTKLPLGPPLVGHSDRVTEVAFSPDGQILASSSRDSTIRFWDVETRQPIGEPLTGHTSRVNSIAFSPDGKTLVSGGNDQTLIFWDVAARQASGPPLLAHDNPINEVVFSPDGKLIASGEFGEDIKLWDAETRRLATPVLEGHKGAVNAVIFSHDGRTLISASSDRTIRLWDPTTGDPLGAPLSGHATIVTALALSPDGTRLVSGSEDNSIVLWDIESGRQLGWPLMGHANSVLDLAVSPDGRTLISASSDRKIVLWDMLAEEFFVGHTNVVRSVDFSPDGQVIASGSSDDTVRFWDPATHQQLFEPVVSGEDSDGQPVVAHTNDVWSVSFSPDGETLASASFDGSLILWDATTGRARQGPIFPPEDRGRVFSVAFSPNGQLLAAGYDDNSIVMWDVETLQPRATLTGHTDDILHLTFSPDSTLLASAGSDRSVRLWDAATGRPLGEPLVGHADVVNSVAFSPDGRLLASGSSDRLVIFWDVASHQLLDRLAAHENRVTNVAFSPDGQTLASGSYDTNIILWNVKTRRPIGPPLIGHTNDVNSLAWRPDGQALVSGSWDDTLILWQVDFASWPERACRIANRNLSRAEWQKFVGSTFEYDLVCSDS